MANSIKAYAFDFDGVILDSAEIKAHVYKEIFDRYPDYTDEMIRYNRHNAGLSRQTQFRHFFENIMSLEYDSATEESMVSEFSNMVLDKVMIAPYIGGVVAFVEFCRIKGGKTYIVTGTPQDEILHITEKRAIAENFDAIYGSPEHKEAILHRIMAENGLSGDELMYFGDAMSDYETAVKCGVRFTGVGSFTVFPEGVSRINDFIGYYCDL